jgi:hypothetical protein
LPMQNAMHRDWFKPKTSWHKWDDFTTAPCKNLYG